MILKNHLFTLPVSRVIIFFVVFDFFSIHAANIYRKGGRENQEEEGGFA